MKELIAKTLCKSDDNDWNDCGPNGRQAYIENAEAVLMLWTNFPSGCSYHVTDVEGNEGKISWIPDAHKEAMLKALGAPNG